MLLFLKKIKNNHINYTKLKLVKTTKDTGCTFCIESEFNLWKQFVCQFVCLSGTANIVYFK